MTQATRPVRSLSAFVRRYQGLVSLTLLLLVASALAFDYFRSDLLGPHLIGLRLIYTGIALLTIGYIWIVSGQDADNAV